MLVDHVFGSSNICSLDTSVDEYLELVSFGSVSEYFVIVSIKEITYCWLVLFFELF